MEHYPRQLQPVQQANSDQQVVKLWLQTNVWDWGRGWGWSEGAVFCRYFKVFLYYEYYMLEIGRLIFIYWGA